MCGTPRSWDRMRAKSCLARTTIELSTPSLVLLGSLSKKVTMEFSGVKNAVPANQLCRNRRR